MAFIAETSLVANYKVVCRLDLYLFYLQDDEVPSRMNYATLPCIQLTT